MEIAFIPRWLLNRISRRWEQSYHLNILISNFFVIAFCFAFYTSISTDHFLPNICLVDYFFGIECPFCGTTRALGAFFHAEPFLAFSFNRIGLVLGAYILLQLPLRVYLISINAGSRHLLVKISRSTGNIIVFLFIINWLINLVLNNFNI